MRGLTQEDFGLVSSRTYLSGLERGLKSPTLGKLEQIASVMQVHPLTLLALTYASAASPKATAEMLDQVQREPERVKTRSGSVTARVFEERNSVAADIEFFL